MNTVELSQSILDALQEGIVSLRPDGTIEYINEAALNLLEARPLDRSPRMIAEQERSLEEIIRNAPIQKLVYSTFSRGRSLEEVVTLDLGDSERFIQAYTQLLNAKDEKSRRVILVLSDVSRLRKLENLRSEFVANVSHELKTPVTAIKGFVETLLDGAIHQPDDAKRFLGIIQRQADRLNAIFEDLLALSRIEQEKDAGQIRLEQQPLSSIISNAVQSCELRARERGVEVEVECASDLEARVHPPLLEQAIVNLLENAIKFSEPQSKVNVKAYGEAAEVVIEVEDHGKGIAPEHLVRIFERFYRVEKSRSRKEGGTGLGLAIVKHIVQAHAGRASVQSETGKGSIFRIHLPIGEGE